MSESDHYRRKADLLLREAAVATNMKERGRLIEDAMHWHNLALDALAHPDQSRSDNDQDDEGQRTG